MRAVGRHEGHCGPVVPGACRRSMPRDMPSPAMILVGATMHALMPCLSSNMGTAILQHYRRTEVSRGVKHGHTADQCNVDLNLRQRTAQYAEGTSSSLLPFAHDRACSLCKSCAVHEFVGLRWGSNLEPQPLKSTTLAGELPLPTRPLFTG